MQRAHNAESTSAAWEDAYSRLQTKARKLRGDLRLAREEISRREEAREDTERYISKQKDILTEMVRANEELSDNQRLHNSRAMTWISERCELLAQRDRALTVLDALTNNHAYEASHLIHYHQMHRIPFEHRMRMGNLLEMACLEARAASGDAQAAAAVQAAVDQAGREG